MFGNPTRNPTWGAYNPICKDKRLTAKLWQESEQALGIELLH